MNEFAADLIDLDNGGIVMDRIDFAFKKILLLTNEILI